jgi:pilus assembly protein CpaE
MRCFVASDESAVAGQVRELFVELGHACPAAHVQPLDRVWGSLCKASPGPFPADHPEPQPDPSGGASSKPAAAEVEIVVVVLLPDPERALAAVRNNRTKTGARVFLVGPTADTKLVLRGLREGASEFLDQGDLKSELLAALKRVSVETATGKTVVLISASGGCGCSTLGVNLAVALAKTHQSCAALDMQLQSGDLAALFDLKPSYSIADLCVNVRRLDSSLLDGCLMAHSSGVQLLAAPTKSADAGTVTEDCLNEVVSLVARRFPFAILDLGNSYHADRTRVLLQADLILVVLRMDFACLRKTRDLLVHLTEIGIAKSRVELVANRSGQPNEIAAGAAEEALGVKLAHFVVDDAKSVNRANNNGIPVLLQAPTVKVSRAIADLAAHIAKASAANA